MQHLDFIKIHLLANKVNVNLDVFGAAMLD
jgi:hypothetical protein